jgi:acidic leucine-rich nuclear phosphoprotein 32 family member A/C/D
MATLKLASNRIATLKDLEPLAELKCLKNLDLENNEVTKVQGYKEAVWKLIPSLEILDNFDKEGNEVLSDSDEDDYGEEAEDELDADQIAMLKERGITPEQFLNGEGFFDDDEEGELDFEGGEDEMFEEGESDLDGGVEEKGGNKRVKH